MLNDPIEKDPTGRKRTLLGLHIPAFITSVATGTGYGLISRFAFGYESFPLLQAMSYSFLFIVPFALGFITISVRESRNSTRGMNPNKRLRIWIMLPWVAALLTLFFTLVLQWEGLACIVIWFPLFLCISSIGGLAAAGAHSFVNGRSSRGMMFATFTLLPFVLSPMEQTYNPTPVTGVSENHIIIHADRNKIWKNIREVPTIDRSELSFSFTRLIGFPDPLEARISGDGVGAVRHATFTGGVLFVETVTEWEPGHLLSFTIDPDPNIPPTTFDEHVVVGGRYFDILSGTYRIEYVDSSTCVLHLSSQQRLSTRFNFYAELWTRFFMEDIQENILQVIKKRCEGASTHGL